MFGFLKSFFRSYENPNTSWTSALLTPPASSGIAVSRETVLGYPAVWRGTNLIASTTARLPLNLYKRQADNGRTLADTHPGYNVVQHPDTIISKFLFFQTLISHVILKGNGYALITKNEFADPIKLTILDPEQTFPVKVVGNSTVDIVYTSRIGNTMLKLLPEELLHFRALSHDGICGYAITDILRESLGLGLALQKFGSIYFKNNARPGTVVELPGFFKDDEEVQKFREGWEGTHAGLDNAHKLSILQGGARVSTPQVNNEQAQWILAREFEIKSIANIMGIPPHKLGAAINANYNSLEQENKSFLSDLEPYLTMVEEELNLKLLTEIQKQRESHYFEFKREALERADTRTENDTLTQQVNNGLLTLNQYFAIKNMQGIGPDGDKHRMPANLVLIEDMQPLAQQQQTDVNRIRARLEKTVLAEAKKETFDARSVLETQREFVITALPSIDKVRLNAWLDNLIAECEAVTRDQLPAVFERAKL